MVVHDILFLNIISTKYDRCVDIACVVPKSVGEGVAISIPGLCHTPLVQFKRNRQYGKSHYYGFCTAG